MLPSCLQLINRFKQVLMSEHNQLFGITFKKQPKQFEQPVPDVITVYFLICLLCGSDGL